MIAFGPVPSRRLGRSLGINNIPPKICTYSCVYCQVGRTLDMRVEREPFYDPAEIFDAVEKKVNEAVSRDEALDHLTFVPDGEPTLDINLGESIAAVARLGYETAVISNASLIWREDVREELHNADWVSLKIDARSPERWKKINRAHRHLALDDIMEGMLAFARSFDGILCTETMLVRDYNDGEAELAKVADFVARLEPTKSYIAIPTRPPAEEGVHFPDEGVLAVAYQLFNDRDIDVEYLIGYEGDAFAFTGDVEKDLLAITAVHPMRERAVGAFLTKAGDDWDVVERLVVAGKLTKVAYDTHRFYIRTLPR